MSSYWEEFGCRFLAMYLLTAVNFSNKQPGLLSQAFKITKFTTINMNSTVFWTPLKFTRNVSITYSVEYKEQFKRQWSNVSCQVAPYAESYELHCLFLTCKTTSPLDIYYEVRVRANTTWNTSVSPTSVYNPGSDNTPLPISALHVTATSSTKITLTWKLPHDFCWKSSYCVEIIYHDISSTKNKTVDASKQHKHDLSMKIGSLEACTQYLFYVKVFGTDSICLSVLASDAETTGPFNTTTLQSELVTSTVRVRNFDTTVYWKYPDRCLRPATKFHVFYQDEVASKWSESNCTVYRNETLHEFSCLLLTCQSTSVRDVGYKSKIRVDNFDVGARNNVLYFTPVLDSIPNQIYDVNVESSSSRSLTVVWRLSPTFCSKFLYCIKMCFNGKLLQVTDVERQNQTKLFRSLLPYTNYSFHVETFKPTLDCFIQYYNCSSKATGPYIGRTLEEAPSSSPVLICGLCDVTDDDKWRNGTVKWKLPAHHTWNGVPRVFIIQWRQDASVWYNLTITRRLATQGVLTRLDLYVDYVVRVCMCNGPELCSGYSKEMVIDADKRIEVQIPPKSPGKTKPLGLYLGVPITVFLVIITVSIVLLYLRKAGYWPFKSRHSPPELPELGQTFSYENVSFEVMEYSQLRHSDELTTSDGMEEATRCTQQSDATISSPDMNPYSNLTL